MFKCHNCNIEIQDGTRFCQNCGASQPQEPMSSYSAPTGHQPEPPASDPAGGQPTDTSPSAHYNSPPIIQNGDPRKQKKMNKGFLIGCIIAGIVVLFLTVALVIGLTIGKDPAMDNPPADQSQPADSPSDSTPGDQSALPSETDSLVGSWERYDVNYYERSESMYTPSQLDFLEDGTVNWYQKPGSENVVTGTYTVHQGLDAWDNIPDSYKESYLNAFTEMLFNWNGGMIMPDLHQIYYVETTYTSKTENGVTENREDEPLINVYVICMSVDSTFCVTAVHDFDILFSNGDLFRMNRID